MTNRTHDLAALTTVTIVAGLLTLPAMSLATALVSLGANMAGAIIPDLDQPTAELWNRIPAGSIIGRVVHPLLGTHRLISHSLLGMAVVGWLVQQFLAVLNTVLLVDMKIVWWAVMLGYFSHLVADTLTKEGVPWLFPIPVRFGVPPLKVLRITTGGMIEKGLVFPGLVLLNGYLIYQNYGKFIYLVTHFVR